MNVNVCMWGHTALYKYYFPTISGHGNDTPTSFPWATRFPFNINIAEHMRTRNHSNIVPINDRSYIKLLNYELETNDVQTMNEENSFISENQSREEQTYSINS